jgi:NADPH:quinone reductase-like Zn-dependent oxidoreductase
LRAAVRDRYGPPDVVRVEHVETPTPQADQVLLRVRAASVNRADLDSLYPRWQFTRAFLGIRSPRNRRLGLDAAGEVVAVGPDVTRFAVGDRVFGDLYPFGTGAFAEFACAPERAFAALGDAMTFDDAATVPHSAILALQGLRYRDGRRVEAGDRVLIAGASGSVGPFAVQVAKARGAIVTGTARTEKLDFVRSLGADEVIDYTTTDWTQVGTRYDWILDVEARHSVVDVRRSLVPGGVFVSLGGPTWHMVDGTVVAAVASRATGRRMSLLTWWRPFDAGDVETIKRLIASGRVVPRIDRSFTLDEVGDALRYMESGAARGKVLVIP